MISPLYLPCVNWVYVRIGGLGLLFLCQKDDDTLFPYIPPPIFLYIFVWYPSFFSVTASRKP